MDIETLNTWLEEQAVKYENSEYLIDNTWPDYYRGLKNLNMKDVFTSEYITFPYTGGCSFKKNQINNPKELYLAALSSN